jgi:hypothetical protein
MHIFASIYPLLIVYFPTSRLSKHCSKEVDWFLATFSLSNLPLLQKRYSTLLRKAYIKPFLGIPPLVPEESRPKVRRKVAVVTVGDLTKCL